MHMSEQTKTVRAVDTEAYRTFRSKAVELGISTGEALTQAMRQWVNAQNRPRVVLRADAEPSPATMAPIVSRPPEQSA